MMNIRIFSYALLFAATACSPQIVPVSAPAPKPAPAVPAPAPASPQLPSAWIDWPIAPGDWVYRKDERGSVALFGAPGGNALVTVRCDRSRGRIYVARADESGAGPSAGGATMTIRASSALKQLNAQPTGGSPAYVAVELLPTDSILDAIAYTRGRIAIETSGQKSIAVPIWAEFPRVIEDCRGS
jgi:hypothetical protein